MAQIISFTSSIWKRYYNHNLKSHIWLWVMVLGIAIAYCLAHLFLDNKGYIRLYKPSSSPVLNALGILFLGYLVALESVFMWNLRYRLGSGLSVSENTLAFEGPAYVGVRKLLGLGPDFRLTFDQIVAIENDPYKENHLRIITNHTDDLSRYTIGCFEKPIQEVKALIEQRIEKAKER